MKQFKSYFIPTLRSKWLTYIILEYTFEYVYEVRLLLRALNTQSKEFHDRLIDEMSPRFKLSRFIKIEPNLKATGVIMKVDKEVK